jgi:tRNA A37 methylthiotransferase MiaB
LHAFAFSPHVDHYSVPAGKFDDQVPNHIAQKRLKLLLAAGNDSFRWLAQKNQNTNHEVLVEKIREGGFTGWTKNYLSAHEANFLPRE